jgi:hypothetical protein
VSSFHSNRSWSGRGRCDGYWSIMFIVLYSEVHWILKIDCMVACTALQSCVSAGQGSFKYYVSTLGGGRGYEFAYFCWQVGESSAYVRRENEERRFLLYIIIHL